MERESRKNYQTRGSARGGSGGGGTTSERDLLLQWGNRKRLRCVKVQRRDVEATVAAEKAAAGQRRAAAVAAVAAATAAGQHHPTGHAHRGLRSVPPAALLSVFVLLLRLVVCDKIQNHRVGLKGQLAVTWYLCVGT
jgi:hypothetical protein